MEKRMFEIMDELRLAPNEDAMAAILFYNSSPTLTNVLRAVYHPGVQFLVTEMPKYKKSDSPTGLGGNTINKEGKSLYLFEANNPRRPKELTSKRMHLILAQILESLELREAEVYCDILQKDLRVPGLTKQLVMRVFPRLLD